jgi:hypothetical protein
MLRIASLLSVVMLGTMAGYPAFAATPAMSGRWSIATCDDLDRTKCRTLCYSFTRVPNTVAQNPRSGTWVSNDAVPFNGHWSQLGDHVTFWGAAQTGANPTAIYFRGAFSSRTELNGDRFITFRVPNSAVRVGNWHASRVSVCP